VVRNRRFGAVDRQKKDEADKKSADVMKSLVATYGAKKTDLLKVLTAETQMETTSMAEITTMVTLIQNYDFCTNSSNLKGFL